MYHSNSENSAFAVTLEQQNHNMTPNQDVIIGKCGKRCVDYKKNRSSKRYFMDTSSFIKATLFINGLSSTLLLASAFSATPTTFTNNGNRHFLQHNAQNRHCHHSLKPMTSNPLLIANTNNHKSSKSFFEQRMSSIENDTNDNNWLGKLQSWLQSTITLPPPPEDQLSFAGDIGTIFFYTFIDHTVNGMYDEWLNSPEVLVSKSASAAIESSFAASVDLSTSITQTPMIGNSFPVWFDLANSAPFGNIPLSSALPIAHHIQYAPALDTTGMASVLLASTWIVCGYFTGAFEFKNTLDCSLNKTVLATAKNWFFTCVVMLAIAYGSDSLVGSIDGLHKSIGLTRADEDFILDSLTVLLAWRFTLNSFFGYGSDDDSDGNK